ncbi:MAG: oligosaccharide flippase family protein [Deltaproteobacteria bacterium]|nr:oligosaccharide flippase family protein [Deltaproteobacteria bacterium]
MGAVGSSIYLTRVFYMIRGIVTARFLGPADYGVWGSLGILLSYSNLAPLGSAEAVGREIPYYTQRGEEARARSTKELAFSFNLYASLLASFAILAYALVHRAHLEPLYYYGLFVVAAGMTLQQLYFFYGIVLRAEKRFVLRSKIEVAYAAFNVPITILLVVLYGIYGLYAAFVLNLLVIVAYLSFRLRIRPRLSLPRRPLVELMRIGFPIYLIGLVYTVFATVDRIVIVKYLSPSDMGFYTIALTLMTVLGEAPVVVAQVMSPSLIERYSRAKSLDEVFPFVQLPTMAIACCFPVLLVLTIFGFEYLVLYVLPRFQPGFAALEILVLGSFFTGVLRGPSSFLLAVRRQMAAVLIYAVAVGIAFGLNVSFVKAGYGLEGVAAATAITYAILLAMYGTYVYSFFFGRGIAPYLGLFGRILLPFGLSLGFYLGLKWLLPLEGGAPVADGFRLLCKTAIYLLLSAPTVYWFLRWYGLWQDLVTRIPWNALRRRLPGGGA